jgi:hypothetical protein
MSEKKKIITSSKQDLLMYSLTDFFRNQQHLQKMLPIIYGESNISLRILDWFVTNYSKKNNIVIDQVLPNGRNKKFIVYLDYKSQLKAYSKKQFDPFCRRERILFLDNNKNGIETTVGQLNFFRWSIENRIIDYVEEHLQEIENDMNQSIRNLYKKNKNSIPNVDELSNQLGAGAATAIESISGAGEDNDSKKRRKRKELSISATKTVNKHDIKIIVKFE